MNHCEFFEIELSTLLDDELSHAEVLRVVDHLASCAQCRAFYRGARALDLALAERGASAEALRAGLWARVERRASGPDSSRARRARPPAVLVWGLRAAAAILVVVGGWTATRLWTAPGGAPSSREVVSIALASNPDGMSDQRFVELTTELLEADPRYHRKMQQIMAAVSRSSVAPEGGVERPAPLGSWEGGLQRASVVNPADTLVETWY